MTERISTRFPVKGSGAVQLTPHPALPSVQQGPCETDQPLGVGDIVLEDLDRRGLTRSGHDPPHLGSFSMTKPEADTGCFCPRAPFENS